MSNAPSEVLFRIRDRTRSWGKRADCCQHGPSDTFGTPVRTLKSQLFRNWFAAGMCFVRGKHRHIPLTVTVKLAQEALPKSIAAVHPDTLLSPLVTVSPLPVVAAVRKVRGRLVNPPMTPGEYVDALRHAGLPSTAKALQAFQDDI